MSSEKILLKKSLNGSLYLSILKILEYSFYFLKILILSRILTIKDFGNYGIVILILDVLTRFTNFGIPQFLIQNKEKIEEYASTAWTFSIIKSSFLFIVLILISPLIGHLYDNEIVKAMFFIGISMFLFGINNIYTVEFKKELEFRKEFIYRFSYIFTDFVISLIFGFVLQSFWALIYGNIAGRLLQFILSYILTKKRPNFHFDYKKFKKLFNFGKWIIVSAIFVFLITEGDDFYVSIALSTSILAYYQMAYRISNIPATSISFVVQDVSFPLYSKLKSDKSQLKEKFLLFFKLSFFIISIISLFILLIGSDFVIIIMGEKWIPMIPIMNILLLWGIIRCINGLSSPVFLALGIPKFITKFQFFQMVIMYITIIPLTEALGIIGTSICVVSSSFIILGFRLAKVCKLLKIKIREMIIPFIYPITIFLFSYLLFKLLYNGLSNYFTGIFKIIVFSLILLLIVGTMITILELLTGRKYFDVIRQFIVLFKFKKSIKS
ncbi:MAG: oligosaccharide flippase family protein [Candidatus Helarchaeota archaeon]